MVIGVAKLFSDTSSFSTPKFRRWHGVGTIGSDTHPGAITRIDNTPVSVYVQVYTFIGFTRVAQVKSSATGEWELYGLDTNQLFCVRIRDQTGEYNGALLDHVRPVIKQ